MKFTEFVSTVSVGIVLLAGSCASPGVGNFADPTKNYPITAEPQAAETEFAPPSPSAGLNPADTARFGRFVSEFLEQGRGSISVSVPDSPQAPEIIGYFGEKLASLGVPRTRILVGTHAVESGQGVKLGYIRYRFKAADCNKWTRDRSVSFDNTPFENFGCSTQHNIAVQAASPNDLVEPRGQDARSPVRRADAVKKYEKGQQSGSGSEAGAKISSVGN